ncbi:MAG: hypothetical protein WD468_02870 [Pirellulales bacterium]
MSTLSTESAIEFLDVGRERFDAVRAERIADASFPGYREVSLIIEGPVAPHPASMTLLDRLEAYKPIHTGFPPWSNLRRSTEQAFHPYIVDDALEQLVVDDDPPDIDFWRIEPRGRFYQLTNLEDDAPGTQTNPLKPGTELDFMLQISRVAEVISVSLANARALDVDDATTWLSLAFRWSGLRGRKLTSWVEPARWYVFARRESPEDVCITTASIPADFAPSAIPSPVSTIVAPLFALYDASVPYQVIEAICNRTLNRRM